LLKDVPTFAELGYPELNGAIWFWLAGPKGLPAPIVSRLNEELRRLIAAPETKQLFENSALLSLDADAQRLTSFIADEVKRWTKFVEEKGLKK
jgi:tripartite-type tricarboxylate transporter receptor subunit TctC